MSSGFKEPKIVVLVGAHPVIIKLEHKVCSPTLATLIGIWIWAIAFDWEREVGRETDDVNFFRYSAHNSNLGEMYLRFSELNSDSRNRRNWSRPTWSFKISSKEKPHLFTRTSTFPKYQTTITCYPTIQTQKQTTRPILTTIPTNAQKQ